jgi:hypothetical protein
MLFEHDPPLSCVLEFLLRRAGALTRMNPNLAEVGKPTRWPPGRSGNPAGKPPGTRTAFSQGFIRDFALVWAEEGLDAVRKVAKKSPEAFV